MARRIHYRIPDDGRSTITDEEWEAISRLQHWYNSEFFWTAGRLALKTYVVFPNWEGPFGNSRVLLDKIGKRRRELRKERLSENAIVIQMVTEGLVLAKKGGYADQSLASGFTKVAGNEFNAYLVCEFLLKVSLIASRAEFFVFDEGRFVKSAGVFFRGGRACVPFRSEQNVEYYRNLVAEKRVFAIVDPEKYSDFPRYRTLVPQFNEMDQSEREQILHDWNWLGFGENYDHNGDDIQGYNLNDKVIQFETHFG